MCSGPKRPKRPKKAVQGAAPLPPPPTATDVEEPALAPRLKGGASNSLLPTFRIPLGGKA